MWAERRIFKCVRKIPKSYYYLEQEQDVKLNFLDLTISKDKNEVTFGILRKPTTTDTIISNDSCHPLEEKMAAIRYFANRIHSYDLNHVKKQKQIDTVKQIILNNKYNTSNLNKIGKNAKQRQNNEKKPKNGSNSHT